MLRDVAESEAGLERLRERWHGREGRLWVTVCPRGVFACSEKLLRFAGEYARRWELLLHSHLDMDDGFRPFVRELFPSAPDTLAVFEQARCLGPRSVWAHATGLTPGEVARLGPASGVAHCAPSNLFWSMGLMPLRAVQRSGAAVGLGSDSGGGPTVSLFDAMRAAGDVSRLIPGEEPAPVEELLTLATLGGARVLGLADHIGSLEPWKQADFILVDDARCDPLYPDGRSPYQSLTDRLSRVIYRPASGMIRATFVGGTVVHGRDGLGGWLA
jgi:guanine deaminase